MKYMTWLAVMMVLSLSSPCRGQEGGVGTGEIPQAVRDTIVESAKANHPEDYATQLFVVRRQTEAYRRLARFSDAPGIPQPVFSRIRNRASENHPDHYCPVISRITPTGYSLEYLRSGKLGSQEPHK